MEESNRITMEELNYWTMEDCERHNMNSEKCNKQNKLLYELSKHLSDVENLRQPPTYSKTEQLPKTQKKQKTQKTRTVEQSLLKSFIDFLDKHKILIAGIAMVKILLISSILGLYEYRKIIESRVKSNNHSLKVTESRAKVKSNQRKKHTESRAKSNRRNKHSLKSSRKSSKR